NRAAALQQESIPRPLNRPISKPEPVEYMFPGPDLLDEPPNDAPSESREEMLERAQRIVESLRYFNIESEVRQITPGPIVTRYELTLAPGVKVGRVVNLSDDLAMALKSRGGIRILAPIPGKAAIGIEVPNRTRSMVCLREIVESEAFVATDQPLLIGIGKNTSGDQIVADLEKMPHLLIAGSTGSGKSVCINTIIASILMKAHPHKVKMIMVDPKVVELNIYNSIPHLLTPVITDPKRAAGALKWAVREMESRYRQLASLGVRDIGQYNRKVTSLSEAVGENKTREIPKLLPYMVIIIDEFADLMVVASNEIEESIARLAQMSRAVGIHLVLATQRPSADVITGLIKANFPSRIAFKVMQAANSRIILDQNGADKLLGMGDMLFLQAGKPEPVRLHGAFISNEESQRLVDFVAGQDVERTEIITEDMFEEESEDNGNSLGMRDPNARDTLFFDAARLVVRHNQGSVSLLQRRLKIGYARAARLIDQLEMAAIVSPYDGSKAREVLVDEEYIDQLETEGL
ncbi:MAG: DNA translocase FtsK, partial [Candidatus Latescibacterota bacterium]